MLRGDPKNIGRIILVRGIPAMQPSGESQLLAIQTSNMQLALTGEVAEGDEAHGGWIRYEGRSPRDFPK